MPLSSKLGGTNKKKEINKNNSIDKNCLTSKQADYIYRKVELGSLINKNTMKEEIDVELDKIEDNSGDENPYRELIINYAGKIENTLSQMEQWSILSNVINYVQYRKKPKNFHTMLIKPRNKSKTRYLTSQVKGLSYVEVLWGVSDSLHVNTTFSVFGFCGIVLMF